MKFNYDKATKNIKQAIDILLKDGNETPIPGDDKFYLRKNKDRIEIRSKESTTWLAYVIIKDIDPIWYVARLFRKYLNLTHYSSPDHFDWITDVR